MTERVLPNGNIKRTEECPVCDEITIDVIDPNSGEIVEIIWECDH